MLDRIRSLLKKKEEKLDCGGRDFDHCEFDECADDELYLVFLRKDNMEKATTPPSLAWLDCPLTYSERGEIERIQKVKILKDYHPIVA